MSETLESDRWALWLIDGASIVARSEPEAAAGWRALRWRAGPPPGVGAASEIRPSSIVYVQPVAWVCGTAAAKPYRPEHGEHR